MSVESKTIQYLLDNQITVSTAESCTGGLLASRFTAQAGISQIYQSGMITYSNDAKTKYLKVSPSTLKSQGVGFSSWRIDSECAHLNSLQ